MRLRVAFRIAWVIVVLASFSLGCKIVNEAMELRALVTDIDVGGLATEFGGLVTDIDMEALATSIDMEGLATSIDVEGLATEIDIESLTTEIGSMSTEMGSFMTDLPIDLGGLESTGVPPTPQGFPADIPIMTEGVMDLQGSASSLEYNADTNLDAAINFYRNEMTARGWQEAAGSKIEEGRAELTFMMDGRIARVVIEEDFLMGVIIKITL